MTFDITPSRWILDYDSFGDASCSSLALTVHIEGGYELGPSSTTVANAHEGRFDFATKTVTPRADGAIGFLQKACGGGSFAVGRPTDIAAGCAGLGAYPLSTCSADYDVVAREGDQLRFGKRPTDNDMCSAAKRPAELSPMVLQRKTR